VRIALVAPLVSAIAQPFLGGAQALLADLAQGLVRRGHAVTLFARDDSSVPGVCIEPITVPQSVHPANFAGPSHASPVDAGFFAQANLFFELFLSLRRRSAEFDLIHAHAFDWPAFACSALVYEIPVLHTLHLPALSPEINGALRVLHQQGHAITLVTVSHACAMTYAGYTSIDYIIYNGLDVSTIPFTASASAEAPLLFAGRIAPEKGVEAAIEIAHRAGRRLLLAGGIYDHAYYEARIAPRLQRENSLVTYLGLLERDKLWETMGRSLGFLFPIEWDEPFGLAAVEAMATGTPVIAFRRGAAVEVIRQGETGFLVEPGDLVQAAAMVDKLMDIPRVQCRRHVEEHFALERMLDEYEQAYREVRH
jgi:UDP-glucose:tetrahydrobiopterin glucosyltransferase